MSSICTATFRRASARDRIRRVSLACTCRITAAVFSPRRTAIASAKRRKSRMTRRRKTEIGVFRRNPTEIPRNNRFTNARKTGILYHVLAPVAQLDRALDSDSKGHAFESHRAYQKHRCFVRNGGVFSIDRTYLLFPLISTIENSTRAMPARFMPCSFS